MGTLQILLLLILVFIIIDYFIIRFWKNIKFILLSPIKAYKSGTNIKTYFKKNRLIKKQSKLMSKISKIKTDAIIDKLIKEYENKPEINKQYASYENELIKIQDDLKKLKIK